MGELCLTRSGSAAAEREAAAACTGWAAVVILFLPRMRRAMISRQVSGWRSTALVTGHSHKGSRVMPPTSLVRGPCSYALRAFGWNLLLLCARSVLFAAALRQHIHVSDYGFTWSGLEVGVGQGFHVCLGRRNSSVKHGLH